MRKMEQSNYRSEDYIADNDEFKCPEPNMHDSDPYVTLEYCGSFGSWAGCRYIKTCKAYNMFLKQVKEV